MRSHTAMYRISEISHCSKGNREPLKTLGWEQHKQNRVRGICVGFGGAEVEAEVQRVQNPGEGWRWLVLGQYVYERA